MRLPRPVVCVSLLLSASFLSAQEAPDFSGVFLRTSPSSGPSAPPVILEISQTPRALDVTAYLNGESAVSHYDLTTEDQVTGEKLRIKDKNLIIQSQAQLWQLPWVSISPLGYVSTSDPRTLMRATEKWALSRDSGTLTIARKREFFSDKKRPVSDGHEIKETYQRKPDLASAKAEVERAQGECRVQPQGPEMSTKEKVSYRDGVILGHSEFRQVSRCISFTAVLAADKLERSPTSRGPEFRLDSKPVTSFPETVVVEVSPPADCAPGWRPETRPAVKPPEMANLKFRARWLGRTTRDLGEVDAKLLHEPWPELSRSEPFFRMQIPAKGVPLTDTLEVRILDDTNRQLGCIAGHI